MHTLYQNTFPVGFSSEGREHHVMLEAQEYETIFNVAGSTYVLPNIGQVKGVLEYLQSNNKKIRIYSRFPRGGQELQNTIHPLIQEAGLVEVIGIVDEGQDWHQEWLELGNSKDNAWEWPLVHISKTGDIKAEDTHILYDGLENVSFAILSGGEGQADDHMYGPVAKLIEYLLDNIIPTWAVCMSFQVLADTVLRLGAADLPGTEIQDVLEPQTGLFRLGTQIAEITKVAKQDPVFNHYGPAFALESYHQFRVHGSGILSDTPHSAKGSIVQILARDKATQEVVAFKAGPVMWATQYHPELSKMGLPGEGISVETEIVINGEKAIIPAGISVYQAGLMKRLEALPDFLSRFHITANDISHFHHPVRRIQHVGPDMVLRMLQTAIEHAQRQLRP